MICYRDMTFCPFHEKCIGGKDCHRALNDEITRGAIAHKLPISRFTDKPWCYDKRKEVSDEQ